MGLLFPPWHHPLGAPEGGQHWGEEATSRARTSSRGNKGPSVQQDGAIHCTQEGLWDWRDRGQEQSSCQIDSRCSDSHGGEGRGCGRSKGTWGTLLNSTQAQDPHFRFSVFKLKAHILQSKNLGSKAMVVMFNKKQWQNTRREKS